MGNFSGGGPSNTQAVTTTTNQQVGVQGNENTASSQSGTVGGNQVASNATSTGAIEAVGAGNTINITSSDIDALHANTDVVQDVLENNQNVSIASVNGAQQVAINALETLQNLGGQSQSLAAGAVTSAQQTALLAVPQSPAAYGEALAAQNGSTNNNSMYVAIAGAVIVALLYLYTQSKK